jgi:hypothetical protein
MADLALEVSRKPNDTTDGSRTTRRLTVMFESIVSEIARLVRKAIRALGVTIHTRPWLALFAIFALCLAW